ncbi:MAG: CpsD/CapB family tyrosine-protein kinase [Firmicutes bacterium]|nr:CpsD/CapB family tyrosine-protein kinase [Bacillota bacterium]
MSPNNGHKETPALITQRHPRSAMAEAYRTLRTNLGFAGLDRPCRSIMVTSPGPGDGKSTTAVNLAIVLAQAGHKVLLMDCDLRKPALHKIFGFDNTRGLTNALVQGRDPLEMTREGPVEGLKVLTSGPLPPNPAELLGSEKMRGLWPRLLENFDYAVVDAPPVLAVTDSVLLSGQVDGVILVAWAGTSRVEVLQDAKEQLVKANARIIGVVLNKVKMPARDYRYYYYYHSKEKEDTVRL